MKRLRFVLGPAILVLLVAPVHAQRGGRAGHAAADGIRGDVQNVSASVQVVFSTEDIRIIREHYAPRYRSLPPGLQKKYAKTGTLPPGWQRKLEPFPVALEWRLPVLAAEYRRGVIDAHAVVIDRRTNVIVDVAVLF